MSRDEFLIELKKLNIILTESQLNQLDKYYHLLVSWNEKFNLTRIIEQEEVYLKHFYDSLTIVKAVDLNKCTTLLDFGTGAGFPGLVLKIVFPHLNITLVDSLQKRVTFLNTVIEELNLENITALHERVENLNNKKYDIITTRAVANLPKLLDYTNKLITTTTLFVPLKANVDEEIVNSKEKLQKNNLEISKQVTFYLPKENSIRNILVIKRK